jgi:hypothetical protein
MKKLSLAKRRLTLSRESIRLLENGQAVRIAGGATGEDCTANFTNCPTTITRP